MGDVASITFDQVYSAAPAIFTQNQTAFSGSDPIFWGPLTTTTTATIRARCATAKGGQSLCWLTIGLAP